MGQDQRNVFLHGHKDSWSWLRSLVKGFAKKFSIQTLKFEAMMMEDGLWRLTVFMKEIKD